MIWLDIIGLTEKGLSVLTCEQLARLQAAKNIITAEKWLKPLKEIDGITENIITWPSPFSEIYPILEAYRNVQTVILATGDPLWFGVGASIVNIPSDEIRVDPALSAFQLAAARLRLPIAKCVCLTLHGRKVEHLIRYLAPKAKLLILAHDRKTPENVAKTLKKAGYGAAKMIALAHIGGQSEKRHDGTAEDWVKSPPQVDDFHVLAVFCPFVLKTFTSRAAGLPDNHYQSDGNMTKAEIRAVTIARLAPAPDQLLWDLGCGFGSVGIEWMRIAERAHAIGVDRCEARITMARENAMNLGVPEWKGIIGEALTTLADLPQPDAVFIGGGLSREMIEAIIPRLSPLGRLVVNAVTVESEAIIITAQSDFGGEMSRIAISRAEAVGNYLGWRPLRPVTQWLLQKKDL